MVEYQAEELLLLGVNVAIYQYRVNQILEQICMSVKRKSKADGTITKGRWLEIAITTIEMRIIIILFRMITFGSVSMGR